MKRLSFIKTVTGTLALAMTQSLAITPIDTKTIVPIEKLREIYEKWKKAEGENYLIIADNAYDLKKLFVYNCCLNWEEDSGYGFEILKMNEDKSFSAFCICSRISLENSKSNKFPYSSIYTFRKDKDFVSNYNNYKDKKIALKNNHAYYNCLD